MTSEQAKDQIRAAAWQLASLKDRGEAARFLAEVAASLSAADWPRYGGGR